MGNGVDDIERLFNVGAVMVFQTDPNRKDALRVSTVLRGWRKPHHLLADRPHAPNGSLLALQEGQSCVLRFVHEGIACAFDSQVLDWDSRTYAPYVRLKWPTRVEQVRFRRYDRLPLNEPCEVAYKIANNTWQRITGEVVDVSLGGCGVLAHGAIDDGQPLLLSFVLPDGVKVDRIHLVVRNVRVVQDRYLLGCAFEEETCVEEREKVLFFVASSYRQQRAQEDADTPRMLIIDTDLARCRSVREHLEAQGYEVAAAHTMVDGLYLLHMAPPDHLLIGDGLPCYNCLGSLLEREGFARVAVYEYGGMQGNSHGRPQPLHLVREVIPDGPSMLLELTKCLQEKASPPAQPALS